MTRRPRSSEVVAIAEGLGLDGRSDPVQAVLDFCRARIDGWVAEAGGVSDIGDLEALVCRRLQMVIEEIRSEEDFGRLKEKYVRSKKDIVFAGLRPMFDGGDNPTYGTLIRRKAADAGAPDRYVAVIDCRGRKAARRFFTRWHEIAHRLTMTDDLDEPVFRSSDDPVERLMDEVAGHVGFYGPIFDPAFNEAHGRNDLLHFGTVEAVIESHFPSASFQSTLCACARRLPTPVIYVEAALGHKAEVKRKINDRCARLFETGEPPPGELRAVRVIPNVPAKRDGFMIPENMRVPEASSLHALFRSDDAVEDDGREDLSMWADSRGRRLEQRSVAVECRRLYERVIAIIQPTEPRRQKSTAPGTPSLFADNMKVV